MSATILFSFVIGYFLLLLVVAYYTSRNSNNESFFIGNRNSNWLLVAFGTLDEVFEMLTWNQLKIHDKKIYLLNSGGFYTHLIHHLKLLEKEGFLYESLEDRLVFCQTPIEIFNKIS